MMQKQKRLSPGHKVSGMQKGFPTHGPKLSHNAKCFFPSWPESSNNAKHVCPSCPRNSNSMEGWFSSSMSCGHAANDLSLLHGRQSWYCYKLLISTALNFRCSRTLASVTGVRGLRGHRCLRWLQARYLDFIKGARAPCCIFLASKTEDLTTS